MPCFDRALRSRTSPSNQYSMIGIMFESRAINRMHDSTELLRLVLITSSLHLQVIY